MDFLTTSRLAIKLSVEPKELFKKLNTLGWTDVKNGTLTELGRKRGGRVWSNQTGREYIVWPVNVFEDTQEGIRADFEELSHSEDSEGYSETSEGEDYIAEYFDEIDLKYRRQHEIAGLEDKYANYRIADFYLPAYNVMVEFAGRWNRSERERMRYRNKKEVYSLNKIPCVWIYPDNLGVLHFIFHKRLESVLGKYGLEKALFSYRLKQFWKMRRDNFAGVALLLLILFFGITPWDKNTGGVWICLAIIAYNLYHITSDIKLIMKGKSVEISRLNRWED